jgi:AcrR family transcriptional regulator
MDRPNIPPDMGDVTERILEAVNEYLRANRMASAAFAEAVGVSPQSFSNWRTRGVPARHYAKIAKILGMSVEDLLGTTGKPVTHDAQQSIDADARITALEMVVKALWRAAFLPTANETQRQFLEALQSQLEGLSQSRGSSVRPEQADHLSATLADALERLTAR